MLVTKEGVVLSRRRKGEADAVISLLTEEGELLQVCIHGILATKKRNIFTSEPGSLISATFYMHGEDSIQSCKEASLTDRFSGIKESYESLTVTAYILDLVLAFSAGEKDPALYKLILSALKRLSEILQADPGRIKDRLFLKLYILFFKIRLLSISGLTGYSERTSEIPEPVSPDELDRLTDNKSDFLKESALRYRFRDFMEICNRYEIDEETALTTLSWSDQIINEYITIPLRSAAEVRRIMG